MSADVREAPRPDLTTGSPVGSSRSKSRLAAGVATALLFVGGTGSVAALPAAAQGQLDTGWTRGSVVVHRPAPNVRSLRERTGLSWQQIADVAGVSRRAVHYWASGETMSDLHADRLSRLESIIEPLSGRPRDEVREFLLSSDGEGSNRLRQLITATRETHDVGPTQADLLNGGGDVRGVKTTARLQRGRALNVQPHLK